MSKRGRVETPLPRRLRELREGMAGVSMQDVADAIGIPKGTYANWEMDRADPPLSMLVPLARFFGVTVDDLLDVDEQLVARHISRQIARLKEADRLAVERIVDTLADANVQSKPRGRAASRLKEAEDGKAPSGSTD
ncbi:helix-turn-helix transcriptional regulator [Mitsuokella jalaludinii]|uniref:helix-turn-helix transcriptional regulator n=1 Tax=Mitsuokella jalaludinii TaxID=187979 RepID=UPI003F966FCD